ncbi:MAG TPA: dTMP kinase [Terriglobales bacterium]|nr:dTMP kinase [Terriglobales bacterium]
MQLPDDFFIVLLMSQFVTFEGGDGTGKTTQIRALENYLTARGLACVVTREPGGTSLGKLLRQVLVQIGEHEIAPATELFLYLADRAQHVNQVIAPALKAKKIVLCDRFTDSTLAYQGYGRGIDLEQLKRFNDVADGGVRPDLTFLLDCPIEIGLARTNQRAMHEGQPREDRFEREKREFHEKVRAGFLDLAAAEPRRFRVVDASRGVDEVTLEIRKIIDRELV